MESIMGDGLISANKEIWVKCWLVIGVGFYGVWLKYMCNLFGVLVMWLVDKLDMFVELEKMVEFESELYAMAFDVIGKVVFNYEFGVLK